MHASLPNPLIELLIALYDIYLIHFRRNLYLMSSLCFMYSVPAAIKLRTPSPLASGTMGALCCRWRTSRSKICRQVHMNLNISYTVVCGIYVQWISVAPQRMYEMDGCRTKKHLHENCLSAGDFSHTVVCGSMRFFNISAAINS